MIDPAPLSSQKPDNGFITRLEAIEILQEKYPHVDKKTIIEECFSLMKEMTYKAVHIENRSAIYSPYDPIFPKEDVLSLVIKPIEHYLDDGFIKGLEAERILKENYPGINDRTIEAALFSLRSSLAFEAGHTENKASITVSNIFAPYRNLWYPKDAVLNLVIEPRDHYIDIETLLKRKAWARFDRQGVIHFLKEIPELIVFDSGYQYFHIHTEEAQTLIDHGQALFCLEPIIALEEECFSKNKTEEISRDPTTCGEKPSDQPIKSKKLVVEQLFNEEIEEIKERKIEPPKNQEAMVKKIYVKGKQRGWFMGEEKKEMSVITRYVYNQVTIATSDLVVEKGETGYSRMVKELKKGIL